MTERFNRRSFLKGGAAAAGSTLALGVTAFAQVEPTQPVADPASGAESPLDYVPLYFNADEMRFLIAACERLIPSDEVGPGAVELGVPEFLDRQMAGPFGYGATWYMQGPFFAGYDKQGWQTQRNPRQLYRDAISAINTTIGRENGGKVFAELSAETQDQVLKLLQNEEFTLDGVSGSFFFRWLLINTKEGYFADPMYGGNRNMDAWRMIGFPGARANFIGWPQHPEWRYRLPPVSIRNPTGETV